MNEEALIADYYVCNNQAVAELIQHHNPILVGWLINRGLSREEAEDCAQDIWVRVMNTKQHLWGSTASRFDPTRGVPFLGWLYRIAHHMFMDALAQHGMLARLSVTDEGAVDDRVFTDPGLPVDEEAIAEDVREAVRDCLNELPHDQRVVLALELARTEHADPPQQRDWADQHGFPPDVYTQRLFQARQRMRECLEKRTSE